jgi:hypothetical protein
VKGVNLIVADALSRAFVCNDNDDDCEQRPRIMNVNAFDNFPDARLLEVKNATEKDASSQSVTELILNGWPKDKDRVPNSPLPFFDMRDELSVVDDVIVKGEAIFLLKMLRAEMKSRLHSSHLGYHIMMRRERNTIFWPGIAKDVKQLADNCEICPESKPRNAKTT